MQLHQLPKTKHRKGKRVGRGGKRGTFSGRGTKGQKSRAGRRIRPAVRDTILRIPKRRGFKNLPTTEKPAVINLDALRGFSGVIDRKALVRAGMVRRQNRAPVKVLGQGDVKAPITVRGLKVSKQAREKIERAGGRVE